MRTPATSKVASSLDESEEADGDDEDEDELHTEDHVLPTMKVGG